MNWIAELRNEGDRATRPATDLEFYSIENLRHSPRPAALCLVLVSHRRRKCHQHAAREAVVISFGPVMQSP